MDETITGEPMAFKVINKTSNTEHGWTSVKHLNVLHHNRKQKQSLHFFLNIFQNYKQLPISGTLDMSGHFHQKQ